MLVRASLHDADVGTFGAGVLRESTECEPCCEHTSAVHARPQSEGERASGAPPDPGCAHCTRGPQTNGAAPAAAAARSADLSAKYRGSSQEIISINKIFITFKRKILPTALTASQEPEVEIKSHLHNIFRWLISINFE